jgi:hypothetical protein
MPCTLEDHSRDYALNLRAGAEVADAYAAWVVAEIESDPDLLDGWTHSRRWPEWAYQNVSECFQCGSPWALLCPDASPVCWQCPFCGCSRPVVS